MVEVVVAMVVDDVVVVEQQLAVCVVGGNPLMPVVEQVFDVVMVGSDYRE